MGAKPRSEEWEHLVEYIQVKSTSVTEARDKYVPKRFIIPEIGRSIFM
jgi:hypothetical protein